jgi:hypothetical protein
MGLDPPRPRPCTGFPLVAIPSLPTRARPFSPCGGVGPAVAGVVARELCGEFFELRGEKSRGTRCGPSRVSRAEFKPCPGHLVGRWVVLGRQSSRWREPLRPPAGAGRIQKVWSTRTRAARASGTPADRPEARVSKANRGQHGEPRRQRGLHFVVSMEAARRPECVRVLPVDTDQRRHLGRGRYAERSRM